jgi:hypothetical protein
MTEALLETIVTLDPHTHQYIHTPSGRVIPSVSSILRKSGVREAPFVGGSGKQAEAIARALKRGREVHRLTRSMDETFDLADAFEDLFDPADTTVENINYVAAYDKFLRTADYRPIAWEAVLYNPDYDYAGRTDGVGWFGTRRIMIDRKTDRTLHKAVWLQLAAYREAWNRMKPNQKIDQTFALVLRDDMSFELKPNPIEGGDFGFFAAAIWMARWVDMVI